MLAVLVDVHLHIGEVFAFKKYRSACGVLHAVETAQKCAFSASGGADNDHLFVFLYYITDVIESINGLFSVFEGLAEILYHKKVIAGMGYILVFVFHCGPPYARSLRWSCFSISLKSSVMSRTRIIYISAIARYGMRYS